MMRRKVNNFLNTFVVSLLFASGWFLASSANAATLSVMPSGGNYAVGSTFDASVFLDTKDQTINAISLEMAFPPDKLQLVSPAVGNSIIGIYTTAPHYNNQTGNVKIVGGINNGINTPAGLVAKFTFRVTAPGSANLRILSSSQVLLNDGKGTDVLDDIRSSLFSLQLDSANGPKVELDPAQLHNQWFNQKVITLGWQPQNGAEGYSYVLSHEADSIPDDIIDSPNNIVVYRDLESGTYYFHIKALSGNNWGPTSHTLVQVDNDPPEDFDIGVWPGIITAEQQPRFRYNTLDEHSGLDRYEIKLVALSQNNSNEQSFFIPVDGEYSPEHLEYGRYDVIVRAYDKAGNIRESVKRIEISDSPLRLFGDAGLFLHGNNILPWYLVLIFSTLILVGFLILSWMVRKRYQKMMKIIHHDLMTDDLKQKLTELEKYRNKYGKIITVVIVALFAFLPFYHSVEAQIANFAPPKILSYPESVTPSQLLYISGKTSLPDSEVIIHIQNMRDGEVLQYSIQANSQGDWFYQHEGSISPGKYSIWTTGQASNQQSPPSAQVEIEVQSVAAQIAGAEITFNSIYATLALIFILLSFLLLALVLYYLIHHKRRHKFLLSELADAEQSIDYGFIQLRHDLTAELASIRSKFQGELPQEMLVRANQLDEDIRSLEKMVDKEIETAKKDS